MGNTTSNLSNTPLGDKIVGNTYVTKVPISLRSWSRLIDEWRDDGPLLSNPLEGYSVLRIDPGLMFEVCALDLEHNIVNGDSYVIMAKILNNIQLKDTLIWEAKNDPRTDYPYPEWLLSTWGAHPPPEYFASLLDSSESEIILRNNIIMIPNGWLGLMWTNKAQDEGRHKESILTLL